MLIIDRKVFQVMSILHRTYRVTRLRVIYLLNTRQGVWEKFIEKVLESTERFRREHWNSSGKTKKLFQGIPLSQISFGTRLEILGGCQKCFGNFWEFSGIKTGNVPELPEPLWLLFAEEKHCSGIVLECVQNCFSGYWNYSRHTEIIWDLTDAENVFVNSKSALWIFFGKHLLGYFQKAF